MADKLHLCLGRRDDINIKSLAEIFFSSKNRARGSSQCGGLRKFLCLPSCACKTLRLPTNCGVPLMRAVIWQSFMFIAAPNLIRIKTIRVLAKKAAVKQAKETIKKTAKKEVAFTHF